MTAHARPLETLSVVVPEAAVPFYESALATACDTVGFFLHDEAREIWRVEGVRASGHAEEALAGALSLAAAATGVAAALERAPTDAEGWLARTASAFPPQFVGRRFAISGTHLPPGRHPGRIAIRLDAGIAFGSGEHPSTQGCLQALEGVAHRRPRRVLDLGCGSAVLAMAAARLLHVPVLAVDIEPWSVRVAAENAAMNGLRNLVRPRWGKGWDAPSIRAAAPFDLVFANILARPLCRMAPRLARALRPGGTAILAGLLGIQARQVMAAYRAQGLRLEARLDLGQWTTLVVRRPGALPLDPAKGRGP